MATTTDIRGAARLAADATAGLTDLVEAMHQRIASAPGRTAADGRTAGLTGLVYKSIRGVTRLVGGSVDALLGLLEPLLGPGGEASPQREAVLAALNGVLGDHLAATHNPLATTMTLRHAGRELPLDRAALAALFPQPQRLLVLVHGLCMNDLQWQREGHDHGAALARDGGWCTVYVRYNSGLPIAENGRLLAEQLQRLLAVWPGQPDRFALLTHSMGGLVARSALQQAAAAGHGWPARLDDLVFLGTPHHGAPLERAGHWIDILLGAAPYAAPLARLGKVRSAGITDLRHGHVRPAAPDGSPDTRPLPLPAGPRCHAIAGTLGDGPQSLKARVAGDGLVPVASAFGQHKDPARALHFEAGHQWLASGVNHMALLSGAAVYAQLSLWLGNPTRAPGE